MIWRKEIMRGCLFTYRNRNSGSGGRMKREHDIGRNTLWNLAEKCVFVLFPLLTYPYAARVLGPVGIGRYSFAASIITCFALIARLGLPIYATRVCAACAEDRGKLNDTASEILSLNILTCLAACLLLLFAVSVVSAMAGDRSLFLLLGLSIVLDCLSMDWLFQAEEEFSFLTGVRAFSSLLSAPVLFLLVRTERDVLPYAVFSLSSQAAACLIKVFTLHGRLRLPVLSTAAVRAFGSDRLLLIHQITLHFRRVLPFFLMACAVKLYGSMDTILLGFLRGTEEVGLYDIGANIKHGLTLFSSALYGAALPHAVRKWESGDRNSFFRLGKRSFHTVLAVQFPVSIFLCVFAVPCVRVLAGDAYAGGAAAARILCLSVLPIGLSNVAGGQLLIPMGRENVLLHAEVAGAASNLCLNLLVIPRFGAVGAAATTLISELIVTVWMLASLDGNAREAMPPVCAVWRMLASMAAGLTVCMLLPDGGAFFALFARAAAFFPIYAVMMLVFRDEWFLLALCWLRGERAE